MIAARKVDHDALVLLYERRSDYTQAPSPSNQPRTLTGRERSIRSRTLGCYPLTGAVESAAATLEDLKTLRRALNANGVDYLLIGGYALAAHGYQRATSDIDIIFPATAATGQRVKEALMILPDQAAKELEPQWCEEGENIRVADAFVVDIMLNANGHTYETLRRYSETLELEGIPVRTVNLEGSLVASDTAFVADQCPRTDGGPGLTCSGGCGSAVSS